MSAASDLPELQELERAIEAGGARLEVRVACEVAHEGRTLPVYAIALGNPDPALPVSP